ncbi:MAG: FAD-dependent oxidoreductase [Alphaproteobacteria bacterium]
MNDGSQFDTPVLIVGAGPVGLALAGDLGWRGVPTILLERTDGSIYQARQDYVGVRTMEFCRRWGIVPWVESSPYPRDYPQDNTYVVGSLANGWEIGRYARPGMDATPPFQQSPQKNERCPQNMFDPVLRRFAESIGKTNFLYHHAFVGFEQDADGVTVEVEDIKAGKTRKLRAAYLVGCDGASSAVRDAAGLKLSGTPVLTYTVNVIFRCAGFERLHYKKPGYRFIFIDDQGTWATVVAINGRDEWRFSIVRASEGERRDIPESEIREAIRRAIGVDFDYEILSVLHWTRRELVANAYHNGRVFIAGDSAHMNSPTGGFGMNTGVQDAVDLSWKLDGALKGWGGAGLLASYTAERQPTGTRMVREASGNLARMLSPSPDPVRVLDSPEGEAARARLGVDFAKAMEREWRTLGMHLGFFYENSPIVVPDGTPAPEDNIMVYHQTARPGHRAPHVWLARDKSTLDLFGHGFVLLRLGADAPDAGAFEQAARAVGLPLQVVALDHPDVVRHYERKLVLVRPDGHVAWRADAVPNDAAAVIDRVRGA